MSNFVFIADVFAEDVAGGGELNNHELIDILRQKGHDVTRLKSAQVTEAILNATPDNIGFIIANFIQLSEQNKALLQQSKKYIIYEHDHKYVKTRNPADYDNFVAPKEEIINYEFYKNALAILCQSKFHADIVKANLNLDNIISLGGNLWSMESINLMRTLSKNEKNDTCAIMATANWHKNTEGAIKVCSMKGWDRDLIYPCSYEEFLTRLGRNTKFLFLPKTPETLCRIVVEARMMGLTTITNNLLGATKEDWYQFKGEELIDKVIQMRTDIPNIVVQAFET